ncbi:MAG: folate-binding protein YgfZ [Candidatus Methylacidiphilales bacterium]
MNLPLYQQLRQGASAPVPLRRALWRLVGPDRARYLNGQVTNDVSRLNLGKSIYAAVTSAKGRMVGDIFIGAAPDALYVDAALELRETLAPRLEKYLIADDAAWEDLTDEWTLTHVFGAEAPVLPEPESPAAAVPPRGRAVESASRESVIDTINARDLPPPADGALPPDPALQVYGDGQDAEDEAYADQPTAANIPHVLANARFGLKGWDIWQPANAGANPSPDALSLSLAISEPVPADIIETLCVEHGLAQWGVDMDEANLPPESLLEQRSISYSKGCYVGQEIIARLKSVGQVNKRLCVLRPVEAICGEEDVTKHGSLESAINAAKAVLAGATLSVGDRDVGRITSAAYSPEAGRILCLGYVNRMVGTDATIASSAGAAYSFTITSPLLTVAKI